jgi:hypothetical protein
VSAVLSAFRVNPEARVHIETIGAACPVLVMDDAFEDPDAVRAEGLRGTYDSSLAYYPGLHSQIAPEPLGELFETLTRLLKALGHAAVRPASFSSDFSVLTTPSSEMLAGQKHPHVDGLPLAGVVYLTPHLEIGTSFFRHVPLGLSMLQTETEFARYGAWMAEHGEATQPETYAVEVAGVWERLHTVAGRYNRLVMYPGNAFHSIDLRDVPARQSMGQARLTQRIFLGALA